MSCISELFQCQSDVNASSYLKDAFEPNLRGIIARAMALKRLNDVFLAHLPDALSSHVRVLNVRNGTMIVAADSGVWATELQIQAYDRLRELEAHPLFVGINSIKCCARPTGISH